MTYLRGLTAVATVVLLAIITVGPAAAAQTSGAADTAANGGANVLVLAARVPWSMHAAPAPCADRGHRFLGAKWYVPYKWSFNAASTPSDLDPGAVQTVLARSFANVTGARNDCGLPDRVSATADFVGTTARHVNCRAPDGHSVIGFGRLPFDVLAVTCYWSSKHRMTEADIKINDRELWALSLRRCRDQPVLEATITHEAGHVFGLNHTSERRHGRLTMSAFADGPCENAEATLGLGDILGLQALY